MEDIVARALLFRISYQLGPGQIAVLRDASHSPGDETIFLEVLEVAPTDGCYSELSTVGEGPYDVVDACLETGLFSLGKLGDDLLPR